MKHNWTSCSLVRCVCVCVGGFSVLCLYLSLSLSLTPSAPHPLITSEPGAFHKHPGALTRLETNSSRAFPFSLSLCSRVSARALSSSLPLFLPPSLAILAPCSVGRALRGTHGKSKTSPEERSGLCLPACWHALPHTQASPRGPTAHTSVPQEGMRGGGHALRMQVVAGLDREECKVDRCVEGGGGARAARCPKSGLFMCGNMSESPSHLCPHIGAHISTHSRTHVRTRIRTHIRTHTGIHIRTSIRTHIRTHTGTHVRTRIRTHIRTHSRTHIGTHIRTHIGTHIRTHRRTHLGTPIGTHSRTHTGTHIRTHIRTHGRTYSWTHIRVVC